MRLDNRKEISISTKIILHIYRCQHIFIQITQAVLGTYSKTIHQRLFGKRQPFLLKMQKLKLINLG